MRQGAAPHEQLRTDIDEVAEQNLALFKLRSVQRHREEHAPCQHAAETRYGIELGLQRRMQPVAGVAGTQRQPLHRIPLRIEAGGTHGGLDADFPWQRGVHGFSAELEMRLQRFAGDEETHDLAAAFEDRVDARVAEQALHRFGRFTTRLERLRGFKAATAADLHRVIHDSPGLLAAPQLANRSFKSHIGMFVLVHQRGDVAHDALHREGVGSHAADFVRDSGMPDDRLPPLLARLRPARADVQAAL